MTTSRSVTVINALPSTLAHYASNLRQMVELCDLTVAGVKDVPIERLKAADRLLSGVKVLAAYRSVRDVPIAINCWPAFGFLDPAVMRLSRGRGGVKMMEIIHDYPPMRRQWFSGRVAQCLGRGASAVDARTCLIGHNRSTVEQMGADGWGEVSFLPLPFRRKAIQPPNPAEESPLTVTVAGQWKPTRSVSLLHDLCRRSDIRLEIIGPGWPEVPGAKQVGAVTEEQFDLALGRAHAVLIPYTRFTQSDVLVRAAELGIPVVCIRHPQVVELWGHDYEGIVEELSSDGVANAAFRVRHLRADAWECAGRHEVEVLSLWRDHFARWL